MNHPRQLLIHAPVAMAIVMMACAGPTDSTSDTAPPGPAAPSGSNAEVVAVEDGDSLVVEVDGAEVRVRLVGINAPERDECLGDEARAALSELVGGALIQLETDVEDSDRFGRLLRYVWLGDTLVNEQMVASGLAIARRFEPNVARQSRLENAQVVARRDLAGMWAPDACGPPTGAQIEVLAIQNDPPGPDSEDLNGEFVIFENVGTEAVDLGGFVLRDGTSSNRYQIPEGFVAPAGAQFVVYVGCGTDNQAELHWCSDAPVWSNDSDELFLTDTNGNVVAFDRY